jgi:hypothetical protein
MAAAALRHARRNLVAYLALFVALGGTSYAAIRLPANSVGARQLKRGAVTAAKIKPHSLLLTNFKAGQLPSASQGPAGPQGPAGRDGTNGQNGSPGHSGTPGQNGRTILNGVGAPVDDSGSPGDFYIDTATDTLYGPKSSGASGAWGSGVDLKGGPGPSYLMGRINSVPSATGTAPANYFGAVNSVSAATPTQSSMEEISPQADLVASHLSVTFTTAPGAQASRDLALLVNDSPELFCEILDSTTQTTCSAAGPVSIPAGSTLVFEVIQQPFNGTTIPATDVQFSLDLNPA